MEYEIILRWLHVIGATVLFGTGAGIAFFMLMAHRTRDTVIIAHTAGVVVLADTLFTATAVVAQPVTGYLLARQIGWSLSEPWLLLSLGLYVLTGIFWLPVVWLQIKMRQLCLQAVRAGQGTPPPLYFKLFRVWFWCGSPAFAAVLGIIWLMLAKPTFS